MVLIFYGEPLMMLKRLALFAVLLVNFSFQLIASNKEGLLTQRVLQSKLENTQSLWEDLKKTVE